MIYFRPFKAEDVKAFDPIEGCEQWADDFAEAVEMSRLAVSGVCNGKVIGCGGVHPIDDFHGELWLRLSGWCREHPAAVARWLAGGFKIIEKDFPFKQINARVKKGFCESERLLKWLGFEIVGDGEFITFAKRVQE